MQYQSMREALLKAVQHLSMPADEQIAYLESLGMQGCVDELGLEFDDVMLFVQTLKTTSYLTDQQIDCLDQLNECLISMSGQEKPALWTYEALLKSAEWNRVRTLARQVCVFDNK